MRYLVFLGFLLGHLGANCANCLGAQAAHAAPAGVDGLSPADIAKAISAIKENFVRPVALSDAEMARATLQGLVDRLAPGVRLLTGTAGAEAASPFYSEVCDGSTGYLRLGELAAANIEKARQTLTDWSAKGLGAAVLDLRGTPPSSDFETGAELARLFCAKGTEMFSLNAGKGRVLKPLGRAESTPGQTNPAAPDETQTFSAEAAPAFNGILVVLVDGETAEAPEAVAACLQKCAKALVVGEKTAGRPFQYNDVPLDGATLRVAVAQVILTDGKEMGENGLSPDIDVGLGAASRQAVMQSISTKGVASVVAEHDRPHLNEVALVAGSNPEVDELQQEQAVGKKPRAPLIDRQLQRALDLVTSISIYQAKGRQSPKRGE